jgi:hypothetical protein
MLGHGAETTLDVIPIQTELLAFGIAPPECDVDVGMLRVEVRHSHPFERRMEICLDAAHHVPCQPLQINTVAELRGDDQLP